MKVYFYNFNFNKEIEIKDGAALSIEVDNPKLFYGILHDLKGLDAEFREIGLYSNGKQLTNGKDYTVIIDYFEHEAVTRAINTKLQKVISETVSRDLQNISRLDALIFELHSYLLNQLEQFDIEFDCKSSCTLEEILKLFQVSVVESSQNIFEKYLNLINVIGELKLLSLVVFVNAKSFFSLKEISEIVKLANYRNIKILFVENKISTHTQNFETRLTVDSDCFDKIES